MFEEIKKCQKCELCKNQPPLMDTKTDCQIIWVGLSAKRKKTVNETPLSPETNTGKLIKQIEEAFLDLELELRTYKTNLVKCVPLNEQGKLRYPNQSEIKMCFEHLKNEIDTLSPKIVFLLGEKVYSSVGKKLKLSFEKWNGFDFFYKEKDGVYYVPIYHPSYIHVYKKKNIDEYIAGIIKVICKLLT